MNCGEERVNGMNWKKYMLPFEVNCGLESREG